MMLFSLRCSLLGWLERLYLLGMGAVCVVCEVVLPLSALTGHLPFLPLLLTSVYCAAGVAYSFVRLYGGLLRTKDLSKAKTS